MERFLSVNETALLLNVTIHTVYRWIRRGSIRAVKLGGTWRIVESSITKVG